jgi:hypothetical protein
MPRRLLGRPDHQEPEFAGARIILRLLAGVLAACVAAGLIAWLR